MAKTKALLITIQTRLADEPIVRVRIHKDKYIPCKLVRCDFSTDLENVWKERQYIVVEKDEVLLDAHPGLWVEPDNTIALRGRDSVHPDDWNALRAYWLQLKGTGHWIELNAQPPPLIQPVPFAVAITDEKLIERLFAPGVDPQELIQQAFLNASFYKGQLDAVKQRGYFLEESDDDDFDEDYED